MQHGHKYEDICYRYTSFEVVCYFEDCIRTELKENKTLACAIRFGHHLKQEHWKKYVDSMELKGEQQTKKEDSLGFIRDLEMLAEHKLIRRR